MDKNITTLGKYDQRKGCGNLSALLILLIFYLKKSNFSLDNKNLKWGEIELWNKGVLYTLATINGTILFAYMPICLYAYAYMPIMPDEVREHLTRDQRPFLHPESLQILQIPSSMLVLLFSSPHSSSTGFRSEDWNSHSKSLVLCSVTHFCVVFEVCVWNIVQLKDPNMAHYKISNRVSH